MGEKLQWTRMFALTVLLAPLIIAGLILLLLGYVAALAVAGLSGLAR